MTQITEEKIDGMADSFVFYFKTEPFPLKVTTLQPFKIHQLVVIHYDSNYKLAKLTEPFRTLECSRI